MQPIETRDIFTPDSKLSRGKIRLWVDMFPINELKLYPVIDIKHKPEKVLKINYLFSFLKHFLFTCIKKKEFEFRIIVWGGYFFFCFIFDVKKVIILIKNKYLLIKECADIPA